MWLPPHAVIRAYQCLLGALCLTLVACGDEGNFSSFPGFQSHFKANPPRSSLPTTEEKILLERFKPRIFLAQGQTRFIDFYADYIAHGKLSVDGELVSDSVDSALLNQLKDDVSAEFVYDDATRPSAAPTIYGRVDVDSLMVQGQSWPLTFLSYNLVFAHSGLLAELPFVAKWGMAAVADLSDWHQLDHYVGLTVVLHQQRPIAYYLQQHNYQTTYLVAEQSDWPSDDRVQVDVALRSNELYPHSAERRRHPGVSFVTEKSMEFVKTGRKKPMMAGWDVTHGQREQGYELSYLPPDDAFYQFKGRLGESRRLPGRDGPPGADYVTLPGLMPRAHRLVAGFRPRSFEQEQTKLAALFDKKSFSIKPAGMGAYKQDFIQAWNPQP